ncbi:MerR family transcriptional regulator [Secundilactobacillus folii]|uniref:MerR family transcriptional regulator n=1 Tax=Secundilactobacillus folii TaxID=2678357 RepID=A0A7X2XXD8_9LACO|nr:MerR family transcriptional regulator [Secundilactobacillus folii]MTV82870.1 MerR family transcriptional regulator [Secundilactobacillus folii]
MTLGEIATRSGLTAERITTITRAGLLPCKNEAAAYSDKDLYWLDMVNCFIENGSSVEDLKTLMPLCETRV